ncbi:hypothetical protein FRC18_010315 [Serendipita sp. 400]|nr:hypothetical protein FRC18_010315 [Serendipita sp. 400]
MSAVVEEEDVPKGDSASRVEVEASGKPNLSAIQVVQIDKPPASEHATSAFANDMAPNLGEEEKTGLKPSVVDTSTLPLPPAYDLFIKDFTIGVPRPQTYLPLPVPIPYPAFLSKKRDMAYLNETIIRNVDVKCGSGEVLAIIGGSGSGKSTLLSAIVGRLANLPVRSGELSFAPTSLTTGNFKTLNARQMKEKIGFVPQNDYLLPNLTVRETLDYAASLRLPASIDKPTKLRIVDQVLGELSLTDAADTVVGGFGGLRKGISGGERRRLSIACILVSLPSVIILDEPTSGLDAFTAYQLLLTLSELAKRNRTVILSLHQPRSDAFNLFTRLLVLSKGSVVYSGLTKKCLPWFSRLGLDPEQGVNPLDFLIDISSMEVGDESKRDASKSRVERLVNAWRDDGEGYSTEKNIRWSRRISKDIQKGPSEQATHNTTLKLLFMAQEGDPSLRRPGIISQTSTLTSRSNKNTLRNYGQTLGYSFQAIVIGVMLGVSYYRLGESPTDIQSLKTLCFQYMAAYFYLTNVYSIYRYCNELVVFDRERQDHLYKVLPWLISEVLSNLSINVFFPSLFAVIVYFMIGLRTSPLAQSLFILIAECILVQLGSIGFSLVSASMVREFASASLMANGISIFFFLSAGYSILKPPVYVNWIKYISVYWYGFRITAISQFKGRVFACENVPRDSVAANQCIGDQVLIGLRINPKEPLWRYFVPLLCVVIGLYALGGALLAFWKPGGVKHAAKLGSRNGKEALPESDMDIIRQRVDVEVKGLGLSWKRPGFLFLKRQQKRIIDNVTFQCPSGQITAIIGPSGAGKSSILQLLAARDMNAGPLSHFQKIGLILINGRPLSVDNRDTVSFVEQEDEYHLPALTVRETLRYAAILRLPQTMSKRNKLARVEEVLGMLGLEDCADTLVGGPLLKGISGGEKRRLSLAIEMLNDPSVLIVDEVTSGLDAATANNVMRGLKSIAESGRTVISAASRYTNPELIDNLVVLAKGGRMVYAGSRKRVESTFQSQGYTIPEYFNPADFLLDVISIDHRPEYEKESRARVDQIVKYWSDIEEEASRREPKPDKQETPVEPTPSLHRRQESRLTPMWVAAPTLLERTLKNMWRQQPVFWVRVQQTPLMGALYLLYYQRLSRGPTGGQDRIGYVQQLLGALPYIGLLNSVAIFPVERDLFFHEYRSSAAYSTATFTLVTTLVEAPFTFIANLLLGLLMNLLAGLVTSPRIYFQFVASTFAVQSLGESIGIIFATFTPSMGLSVSLVSTALSIIMQFAGYTSLSVPKWLQAIAWATPPKPASRIMIINEASGLHLNCSPESIQSGECLIQSGEDLINLFQWKDLDTGKLVGILMAVCIGWRLLAWVSLMIKMRGW